ncbi:acetamidase/formamidase family protein [Athalassotoga saccharophila]|uniref:acetamidase/formamidase family protein n=1 Tax=Athalassotoga saccharophila TaxID=1441386 RepID=UPI00137A713B|nr:acetamidase/formamidase family protein [Athalassotoga saccharophila]BBJ28949.1 formamidase [Athalassotoga saccharophila]
MIEIKSTDHFFNFSPKNKPVVKVSSGTILEVETMDCFSNQIQNPSDTLNSIDWSKINPATGPIFVEEAEEGDTLKIEIMNISIANQGVIVSGKGEGLLGHLMDDLHVKIVQIKKDMIIFDSKLSIPVNKMIGVIGVAPKSGEISCGIPGPHGGNMDNMMITTGSTLYLPVYTKGALLGIGDLHAAMGDGEIGVSGVEVAGNVKIRVKVLKNLKIKDPVLSDDQYFTTISSAKTIDAAIKQSAEEMANILKERLPLNMHEIVMLMSISGHAEICQVVDPLKTARFVMPNWILNAYKFDLTSS